MKYLAAIFVFIFSFSVGCFSQSAVNQTVASSFKLTKNSTVSLRYSVGEIAVKKISGSEYSLSPGSSPAYSEKNQPLGSGNENISETQLKIYPNPVQDHLMIEHSNYLDIVVLDMVGNVAMEQKSIGQKVSFQFLPAGLYIIQLHDKNGNISSYKISKI